MHPNKATDESKQVKDALGKGKQAALLAMRKTQNEFQDSENTGKHAMPKHDLVRNRGNNLNWEGDTFNFSMIK